MIVTLTELKAAASIDADFTEFDSQLQMYAEVAEQIILEQVDIDFVANPELITPAAKLAILVYAVFNFEYRTQFNKSTVQIDLPYAMKRYLEANGAGFVEVETP